MDSDRSEPEGIVHLTLIQTLGQMLNEVGYPTQTELGDPHAAHPCHKEGLERQSRGVGAQGGLKRRR